MYFIDVFDSGPASWIGGSRSAHSLGIEQRASIFHFVCTGTPVLHGSERRWRFVVFIIFFSASCGAPRRRMITRSCGSRRTSTHHRNFASLVRCKIQPNSLPRSIAPVGQLWTRQINALCGESRLITLCICIINFVNRGFRNRNPKNKKAPLSI